jgi:hypothetical protein
MNFTGDGAFEQSHNALGSGSELKTQARVAWLFEVGGPVAPTAALRQN